MVLNIRHWDRNDNRQGIEIEDPLRVKTLNRGRKNQAKGSECKAGNMGAWGISFNGEETGKGDTMDNLRSYWCTCFEIQDLSFCGQRETIKHFPNQENDNVLNYPLGHWLCIPIASLET